MSAPEADEPQLPTPPPSAPPRSEALEAELAMLEALLPAEPPPAEQAPPLSDTSHDPNEQGGTA